MRPSYINLTGALKNCRNLLLNIPPSHIKRTVSPIKYTESLLDDRLNEALKKKSSSPIFVIGLWGVGKTLSLQYFFETHRETYDSSVHSFFSIQSLREAYLLMLGFWRRVLCSFILATLLLSLYTIWKKFKLFQGVSLEIGEEVLGAFLLSWFFFFFITNRMRAFYAFAGLIDFLTYPVIFFLPSVAKYWCFRTRVTIIEDLDRSSMKKEDQWALLSNLWNWKRRYIVSYGYRSATERVHLVEVAQKLEAEIIELHSKHSINFEIIKNLVPLFPFDDASWMANLTPRETENLASKCLDYRFSDSNDLCKQALIIKTTFNYICEKLEITPEQLQAINYRDGSRGITISASGNHLTWNSSTALLSFGTSIQRNFLNAYANHYNLKVPNSASNWKDLAYNALFRSSIEDLQAVLK